MTAAAFPQFTPHPLLRNGHLQTILSGYLSGRSIAYRARQHVVDLADGDRIVLHDDRPPGWSPGDRTALLIHGVAGSHLSPYQVRIAAKLNAAAVRTFRMDLRGCGAGVQLARRPGHAGRSEDAAAAVSAITRICPASPVTMIGFSMGGNIALKLMGEAGQQPPGGLDSCMAVAPPIDLRMCAENIERGINRFYSRRFARTLMRHLRQHRSHESFAGVALRKPPQGIVEFDDRITAPLSGFSGASEYYRQSSAEPVLDRIAQPTLVIAAEDDPVIPVEMFRRAQFSAATQLVLTRHGGHVAFIGVVGPDADRWWLDWRIVHWVTKLSAG